MKKEVILVPKDKCPLDVLAEMGERTKNAWIFLHQNATEKLKKTADECKYSSNTVYTLLWNATDEFPEAKVRIDIMRGEWSSVARITADDIAFKQTATNPEDIFFLKMDE